MNKLTVKLTAASAYVLARLKEPSTWRGMILVATAMGAKISEDRATAIVTVGLALAGIVGAVMPDTTARTTQS